MKEEITKKVSFLGMSNKYEFEMRNVRFLISGNQDISNGRSFY